MLNSIRGFLFGADAIDGYTGLEVEELANTLRVTATDDEWELVDSTRKYIPP